MVFFNPVCALYLPSSIPPHFPLFYYINITFSVSFSASARRKTHTYLVFLSSSSLCVFNPLLLVEQPWLQQLRLVSRREYCAALSEKVATHVYIHAIAAICYLGCVYACLHCCCANLYTSVAKCQQNKADYQLIVNAVNQTEIQSFFNST